MPEEVNYFFTSRPLTGYFSGLSGNALAVGLQVKATF